ncbi:hypothetical protein G6F56_011072 [Rhizopus delemar]|nr:hypothetical protein G6F56_011072 [Rhizopus delemar]
MDEMHVIDIGLDDSSDSESEAGLQNDSDYNPKTISEPPRAIRRITRSRRAVVIIKNQEVEPRTEDLHLLSSTSLKDETTEG